MSFKTDEAVNPGEEETLTDVQFDKAMKKMQKGDRNALKGIYSDYVGYIYSCIYNVVKNRENAEDLTGDFFLKLWDISGNYKPGGGHRAWMARIARNMSIDFLRKRKRETLTDTMGDAADRENEGGNGATIYDTETNSPVEDEVISDISIKEALLKLTDEEREVINMKIMGDLTFREISEIMNLSMGTVTWKYQSAIKKLRGCGYE